eukprot:s512_g3.t1
MELCTVHVQLLSGEVCAERRLPRCDRVLEALPKVEEMPGRRLAKRVLLLDGRILLAEEVLGELDAAGTGSLVLQLIWQNRQVLRTEPGPFEQDL